MDAKTEQDNTTGPDGKPVRKKINPGLKLVLEMGPLVAFFFTNYNLGIFAATGVLIVCVVATHLV